MNRARKLPPLVSDQLGRKQACLVLQGRQPSKSAAGPQLDVAAQGSDASGAVPESEAGFVRGSSRERC